MASSKCLRILCCSITAPTASAIWAAPAERLALASDSSLDAGEVAFGCRQQFLALARALGSEIGIAANNQPLIGEVGAGDGGHVALVEQRELQGAALDQLLDRWGAQRGDPVEPGGLDIFGETRLGDQPRSPTRTT